jgi:hypothetical protein
MYDMNGQSYVKHHFLYYSTVMNGQSYVKHHFLYYSTVNHHSYCDVFSEGTSSTNLLIGFVENPMLQRKKGIMV